MLNKHSLEALLASQSHFRTEERQGEIYSIDYNTHWKKRNRTFHYRSHEWSSSNLWTLLYLMLTAACGILARFLILPKGVMFNLGSMFPSLSQYLLLIGFSDSHKLNFSYPLLLATNVIFFKNSLFDVGCGAEKINKIKRKMNGKSFLLSPYLPRREMNRKELKNNEELFSPQVKLILLTKVVNVG